MALGSTTSRGKSAASKVVSMARVTSTSRSSRVSTSIRKKLLTPAALVAERQHVEARFNAERSVLWPALQRHLSELAQEDARPTSDVIMHDDVMLPLDVSTFEEAPGNMGYVDAVRAALSEDRAAFRRHEDKRTTRDRMATVQANWRPLLDDLADAYLVWKNRAVAPTLSPFSCCSPSSSSVDVLSDIPSPIPPVVPLSTSTSITPSSSFDFDINVYDIYSLDRTRRIHRTSEMKTAVALMSHGLLSHVPLEPSVAFSLPTLELYRVLRSRKPSLSVEVFAKVISDVCLVPYRPRLSYILGEAFEIYLKVLQIIDSRVKKLLRQDTPHWRVKNACPACTYELEGEPKLRYRRMLCMDGNDSLKRMRTTGQRTTADNRVFTNSDYYIPSDEVDTFANEVRGHKGKAKAVPSTDSDDEWEDVDDVVDGDINDAEGDPTDGTENTELDGCVRNWKAAKSDDKKKSWDVFEENGAFASACRHGFILWIEDMVRSGEQAKYPLAIVNRALSILGDNLLIGYDIGCAFEKTIRTSSLGQAFTESSSRCVVNAYHGYSHNFACQCKNHPNVIEGMGIEDLETMERIFSASNEVAGLTRHATAYRRRLFIDMHFRQWDEEKYRNLGSMIFNNYRQALHIILEQQLSLDEILNARKITVDDLDRWQDEQTAFFATLGQEPVEDIHRITYVELLQQYRQTESLFDKSSTRFLNAAPTEYHFDLQTPLSMTSSVESYRTEQSRTQKLETQRRYAADKLDILLREIIDLEVKLNIAVRWSPTSPEYLDTIARVRARKYHKALERLQRLVVQRLFELHRLNLSGIAYKARQSLGKSLHKRSGAIRRATTAYNKAARELTPPRSELNWTTISKYNYIEELAFLADSRNDIRAAPWSDPVIREAMKIRLRVKRAQEELIRCNIESRRVFTHIYDEKRQYRHVLDQLRIESNPLHVIVQEYYSRREGINGYILQYINKLFALPGFSGNRTIGRRVGIQNLDYAEELDAIQSNLPSSAIESDTSDGDEEEAEENAQIGGLVDYVSSLTLL